MAEQPGLESSLTWLRSYGWTVAVHNDYVLHGGTMTFWLFTHAATGYFVKGEGYTDDEAVREAVASVERLGKTLGAEVKREQNYRGFARIVVSKLALAHRWPCPDCGRAGPTDPLRLVMLRACDPATREATGPVKFTGCVRCVDHDPLVAEAQRLLTSSEES